jgi:streptogramin lyase
MTIAGPSARLALALMILLVVLALGAGFAGGAFSPRATPTPSPSPTQAPTAKPTAVASPILPAPIPVVADASVEVIGPIAMVTDGTSIWVLGAGRIDQIDALTNSITDSVTFGPEADLYNGLAWNGAGLWASDSDASAVFRIGTAPLALVTQIPAGSAPKGVLADDLGVWVADVHGGTVLRIDPANNEVADTVTVGRTGPSGPNWLVEGLDSIWVDVPNNGTVARFDPVSQAIQATIDAPAAFVACGGMAIADDAVWVTSCSSGTTMARLDANSNTFVAKIGMEGNGYNPTVINGYVWVSVDGGDAESGKLVRIDPATNLIDRVLVPSTTFGGGGDIVVAAGSVWVVDGYHNTVIRLPLSAFVP